MSLKHLSAEHSSVLSLSPEVDRLLLQPLIPLVTCLPPNKLSLLSSGTDLPEKCQRCHLENENGLDLRFSKDMVSRQTMVMASLVG